MNDEIKVYIKKEKAYKKRLDKEKKEAIKGNIKARVFFNKHKGPVCCLPCHFEKVYFWLGLGYKEISKDSFKIINNYDLQIKSLKKQKEDFIRLLIDCKEGLK